MTLEQEIWFMYRQGRDKKRGGQPTTETMWEYVDESEKQVWEAIVGRICDECLNATY